MKIKYVPGFQDNEDEPYFKSIREKYSKTLIEGENLPKVGDTVNLFDIAKFVDLTQDEEEWMLEVIYEQEVKEVKDCNDYYQVELTIE